MKVFSKIFFVLVAFVFLLPSVLFSCKEHLPVAKLTVTSLADGYPGEVKISTEGSAPTKKKYKLNHYQLSVSDPKGQMTLHDQVKGQFPNQQFTIPGQYKLQLMISDVEGQSAVATADFTVKDPFKDFAFNAKHSYLKEDEGISEDSEIIINLNYLDATFHQFISRVAFRLVQVDEKGNPVADGYERADEWVAGVKEEVLFEQGVKLGDPANIYMLYATAYDRYDNASETISTRFYVKDKKAPVVNLHVFGQIPESGKEPIREEFTIDESGLLMQDVYEYSTMWFSAAGSEPTADETDTLMAIESVEYKLYAVTESGEKNYINGATPVLETEEIAFEIPSAGNYKIETVVKNTRELKTKKELDFVVIENKPFVTGIAFGNGNEKIFEAIDYNIGIQASSIMPKQGKITWATVVFENEEGDIRFEVPVRSNDEEIKFQWNAFVWDLQEDRQYHGYVTVENMAGRCSDPKPFSILIRDNTPQVGMSVTPSVQMINFGKKMTIVSTPVLQDESGNLTMTVNRSQADGTIDNIDIENTRVETPAPGEEGKVINTWTLVPEKIAGDADVDYTVTLSLTNTTGYSEARKMFTATAAPTFLTFDIRGEASSAKRKYYAGSKILLDATGSQFENNPTTDFSKFKWKVEIAGAKDAYVDQAAGLGVDRLKTTGEPGVYELLLGESGYYTITLNAEGYPNESKKLIMVENMAPVVSVIQYKEVVGSDKMSRPVSTKKTPGQIMELCYELTAEATIADNSPIVYQWYIDTFPFVAGTKPSAVEKISDDGKTVRTYLAPGEHRVYVVASKQGTTGNDSRPVWEDMIVAGLKGPEVKVPREYTNELKPTWTVSKSIESDEFRYQIRKSSEVEKISEWTVTNDISSVVPSQNLTGGDHTNGYVLYVQQRNKADGRWSDSGYRELFVDTQAPDVSVVDISVNEAMTVADPDSPDVRLTGNGMPTGVWSWEIAGGEALKKIKYAINDGEWTEVAETATAPNPFTSDLVAENKDEVVTLKVQVQDLAGNWSTETATSQIRIDRVAPPSPVDDATPLWINNRNLTFKWKNADGCEPLKSYNVELEGTEEKAEGLSADVREWSTANAMPETELTPYTLAVYAVDLVGNISQPVRITQNLDTVAPNAPTGLAVVDGAGVENSGKAMDDFQIMYTAPEADVEYLCGFEKGKDQAVSDFASNSEKTLFDLTVTEDSWYTCQVKAKDLAGNTGVPASINFYRDTTGPVVTSPAQILAYNYGDVISAVTAEMEEVARTAVVTDEFDPMPANFVSFDLVAGTDTFTRTERKAGDNLVKITVRDNLGNEGVGYLNATVAAPTVQAWPAFAADASDPESLKKGGAYSITKAGCQFQYFSWVTKQDPQSEDFPPKTKYKVNTGDLDSSYDGNQMMIGVYNNKIHFIGQRKLGGMEYVRNTSGIIECYPAVETGGVYRLWKGVTYEVYYKYEPASQDGYGTCNVELEILDDRGSRIGEKKTAGTTPGKPETITVRFTPDTDLSDPAVRAIVVPGGASDKASMNLTEFGISIADWPGK